jgi:TolB-like protein/tetratricopeptide (TPR) repeat protein
LIGQSLSHYRITAKLGEGGMGVVYRARDTELGREVAIKVLPQDVAADPERLQRLLREAKTVAKLNHPNIVTIYSVEQASLGDGGEPIHFLTMELIEGLRLCDLIPARGVTLERFFELAIPLADAVSAAHQRGVTHRDLKPANVMVTGEGHLKVLDFGLAKATDLPPGADGATELPTATLTADDRIAGTVAYMSPQQVEGKPLDHRSDIFSLGVVLVEMVTGRNPFQGGSSAQIMSAILRDTPPPATALRPDVPQQLDRILNHCLEKEPEDRFQTARDVHNELRQLKAEIESKAIARSGAAAAMRAPGSPRKVTIIAVTALALAAAGVTAYLRSRSAPAPGSAPPTRLAVLPLANLTGDPDQGYLAQGISSFLINQLGEIPELSVLSLNFVASYDGTPGGVRRLVRDSRIDAYVEGHVEARGESLHVYVNLTDAKNGAIIHAMDFDATAGEVFELQNGIAQAVSHELGVTVSAASLARLRSRPPASNEAFLQFLEGLSLLSTAGTAPDAARAESLFRRALREDPQFAYGHWGLSQALLNGFYAGEGPEFLARAEASALTALRLDAGFQRARITLAEIQRESGRLDEAIAGLESLAAGELPTGTLFEELAISYDGVGAAARADASLARALQQRSDSEVYRNLGRSYASAGNAEKARQYFDRAVAAEPDLWVNHDQLGLYYLDLGHYDEARVHLARARELAPQELLPLKNLGRLELEQNHFAAAIEIYETIPSAEIDAPTASNLGTAYFYLETPGSLAKAEEYYLLAVRLRSSDFQLQANLGDLYARQGRASEARARYSRALALVDEQLEVLPEKTLLRLKQPVYLAKVERCGEAVPLAEALDRDLARSFLSLRSIAQAFALCGEEERALDVLEEAVPLGYPPAYLRLEDEFKSLHSNPRFEVLVGG